MPIQYSYSKEGKKITHPTGVVQVLSIADLERFKTDEKQHKAEIEKSITRIDVDIQKITSSLYK